MAPFDASLPSSLNSLRAQIRSFTHADEEYCVSALLQLAELESDLGQRVRARAASLIAKCRAQRRKRGSLDAFLHEFGLSNREGIALMCLAEALLRIPNDDTADQLINEKVLAGDWKSHSGKSDSLFVNASTWGLMLTGGVINLGRDITANPAGWVKRLTAKLGEPVIRQAITQAMRIMGKQYVLGADIREAASRGRKEYARGTNFSFDMLGEGARTHADAKRYFDSYMAAIKTLGEIGAERNNGATPEDVRQSEGISIKLSALHPRYHFAQSDLAITELLPKVKELAVAARERALGFTIDAEESERLDLSLTLFEQLARDTQLSGWNGLGLAVQAYQKRAPYVIDWLAQLASDTSNQFTVRLVKGAYWDREIKHAQEQGFKDYPVYTRKAATDLCYQECVMRLFAVPELLYPQFATHNAYSIAFVIEASGGLPYEFQRLHGMGGLLYEQLSSSLEQPLPLRVYAPVGAHKDLLPYLVRRLLENGANSSFVNRFLDADMPIETLATDPSALLGALPSLRHPRIPLPRDIYRASARDGSDRNNSPGIDLDDETAVKQLYRAMSQDAGREWFSGPIVGGEMKREGAVQAVINPANKDYIVGRCYVASDEQIDQALCAAVESQFDWDMQGGKARHEILLRTADLLEQEMPKLMALICKEAGRTIADALSEVREAADFCRYYGLKARQHFGEPMPLPGPTGEENAISLHGRGVFLCISPWNFPLAIFVGQVAAALAAGNSVIAKPAEQTPLIAAQAVLLFHRAGVPADVLHLLPGKGSVLGPKLIADERIAGVAVTGSMSTAQSIHRQLAGRAGPIVPLIAETGGQNAMIVDSSALIEQVVDDAIQSAFQSAGQRCSALRVLYLQQDIADDCLRMLAGAMEALIVDDPYDLASDVGPVIHEQARRELEHHLRKMHKEAKIIAVYPQSKVPRRGSFFAPCILELKSIKQLSQEVFGPVLHVIRYSSRELDRVIKDINESGYGLTLGIHTRVESTADYIFKRVKVGNIYINRNMVGAVVGVQPFGGQGLSGTGPKAGGPHYLFRFAAEKTKTVNTVATGGNAQLFTLE